MNQTTVLAIDILELLENNAKATFILERSKLHVKHFLKGIESLYNLLRGESFLFLLILLILLLLFISLSVLTKHFKLSLQLSHVPLKLSHVSF